jgi:hypothetical protein
MSEFGFVLPKISKGQSKDVLRTAYNAVESASRLHGGIVMSGAGLMRACGLRR